MISLRIDGPPRAAGRPRFGRGKVYRDPEDEAARQAIQAAWLAAGRPTVEGAWQAQIQLVVPRPATHWCKSGLSAKGRDSVAIGSDVDNYAKLALDALVEVEAVSDDRNCLRLDVSKHPAERQDPGCTVIEIRPVE